MTSKQSAGILLYRQTQPDPNAQPAPAPSGTAQRATANHAPQSTATEPNAQPATGSAHASDAHRAAPHHTQQAGANQASQSTATGLHHTLATAASLEVFLVHPGGPFWKNKNEGSWTIPKGEFTNDEPALDAAIREFREETGVLLKGYFQPLTFIRQKGGKKVYAWAIAGNLDPETIVSNTFEIEWPRKSGQMKTFPEIDKGGWFSLANARLFINPAQTSFLDELEETMRS